MDQYQLILKYNGIDYEYELQSERYKFQLIEQAHAKLYRSNWTQVEFKIIRLDDTRDKVVYHEGMNGEELVNLLE